MKRDYTKHSKEVLEPIVASSFSYAQCLEKLSLRKAGGNYLLLQRNIEKFDLDASHFTHQASNKGKELKPFEGLTSKTAIRKRLLKRHGTMCQSCNNTEWLGHPIPVEVHHLDGNPRNNSESNLQLLCPNCHSTTDNFRNKKR